MPTVELDKVSPASAAALQLGDSGDTITVPSGVTLTATDATVSLPATITASTEIKTNKISPGTGTAFTFGDSGDTFNIPSGATITNSGTASGFGDCVLLSTQTLTAQTSAAFTTGITSTYKEYVFVFIGINPSVQQSYFEWQASTDGGSSYGINITSTAFGARHNEDGSDSGLQYEANWDLAQSTNYQYMLNYLGADADECAVGELHLFNPASTTYAKNWYGRGTWTNGSTVPAAFDLGVGGYINTTTAINAINFKMSTGNFDGTIKMYGYT